MAKSNAARQAEWRLRRKQELNMLRNGLRNDGRSIIQLTEEEHAYLLQELERFRAEKGMEDSPPDRFDAIQSVMKIKVEVDKTKAEQSAMSFRKTKPVSSLNRDLFDQAE